MAERVEIDIRAKDKASSEIKKVKLNLKEMGEQVSNIGMRVTAAFTLPVVGAFTAAVKNSEDLQNALKPLQEAFAGVSKELGDALVPMVKEATPYIVDFAKSVTSVIQDFEALDPGTQKGIVGFIGFLAATGPALMITGQALSTIGTAMNLLKSVGAIGGAAGGAGAAGAGGLAAAAPIALAAGGVQYGYTQGIGALQTATGNDPETNAALSALGTILTGGSYGLWKGLGGGNQAPANVTINVNSDLRSSADVVAVIRPAVQDILRSFGLKV